MNQLIAVLFLISSPFLLSAQPAKRFEKAASLYQNGKFPPAYDSIKTAIDDWEAITDYQLLFDALLLKYHLARNLYKKRTALKTIKEAERIHENHLPENYRKEELLVYLAVAYSMRDQFEEAQPYLEAASKALEEKGERDSSLLAFTYYAKALSPLPPAEKTTMKYKTLAFASGNQIEQVYLKGQLLRWLGNNHRSQTDYEQATKYYQQELNHYSAFYDSTHFDIATAHYNIGSIFYELLEYQKALHHYKAAYPAWSKRFKPKDAYMRFLNEAMGDLYFELANKEKALYYYDQSVLGEKKIDYDSSGVMTDQGTAYLDQGQAELAMSYYEQALKFREDNYGKIHPLTGACNNFIARAYRSKGQQEEAMAAYQHSLIRIDKHFRDSNIYVNPVISREASLDPYFLEALFAKGELFLQKFEKLQAIRDLEMAFFTFEQCIQIVDWIRQSPITEGSKLLWTQKAFPVYEQAISTALLMAAQKQDSSYLYKALDVSEKSKSFLLLSSLHERNIHQFAGLPAALIERENQLRTAVNLYNGKIAAEEKRCSARREKKLGLWKDKILLLQRQYHEYLNEIKKSYPDYYRLKYDVNTTALRKFQASLKESGQAVIEFFEGEEKGFVFVLTANQLTVHPYQKDSSFLQQIRTLRSALSNTDPGAASAKMTANAYQLYRKLLKAPLQSLPASISRLIIIPDGLLSYLPFECLLTEALDSSDRSYARFPYLLRKYAISYGQSVTLIEKSEAQSESKNNQDYPILGFAPVYSSGNSALAPLQFNQAEVEQATQVFDGTMLSGTAATRQAFLEKASQANIIHLALHAQASDEHPLLSSLYFSGEGDSSAQLYVYELYNTSLNAQLAVLSACNTGTGQWIRGEGIMSLSRGFQYAGCPSILTSLWTIDDQSTAELMQHFYQQIKAGHAKDEALRLAKLQYLDAADPATAHPAYWAAFTMIGNTSPLEFNAGINYWTLGLLMLLAAFLWGVFRKRR